MLSIRNIFLLYSFLVCSCQNQDRHKDAVFTYKNPNYAPLGLTATNDTLHFILNEDTYSGIKSFHIFTVNGITYSSFFDKRSQTINIYDFHSLKLIRQVKLKKAIPNHNLDKTNVHMVSFDTIFVTIRTKMYLIDSAGNQKQSISFLQKPALTMAIFDNTLVPVFKNGILYSGLSSPISANSLNELKRGKALYEFNLEKDKAYFHYKLPKIYHENLYGSDFLDYGYCYNSKDKFVFSFPADTNIYETDLKNYHIAYTGKSQYQLAPIPPVKEEDLVSDGSKQYAIRDSYGPILYDPYYKRYLRHFKQKLTEHEYKTKSRKRKESVIVFDENLRIIGEAPLDSTINFKNIFFADGNIYARVKFGDEYALHFVRLTYSDQDSTQHHFARQ